MIHKDIPFFEKEFSKNASNYHRYNIIQKQVAKELLTLVENRPSNILDLGCGSGEIYKLIDWEIKSFTAVDISKQMCELHPSGKNIKVINADYEKETVFWDLKKRKYDMVISSSSLQWSKDLDAMVKKISNLCNECAVSVFCKGTFKTVYKESGLESFLPEYKEAVKIFERYFDIKYQIKSYKLFFPDNISKFRYIKKSGVSGGRRKLNYKQTKDLIRNYPLEYLEFEVLYVKGLVLKS